MPRRAKAAGPDERPIAAAVAHGLGGRLTVDSQFDLFGTPNVLVPPRNAEDLWHLLSLDSQTMRRISPAQLMELLADLSPDVSRALWDFLRLCNPGWEVAATRPGTDDPDIEGQAMVDAFMNLLADLYGSADVVIGRLFISAFLRGSLMAELVLDLEGRAMVDLATPDPISVVYIRRMDPVRGHVNVPVQWQNRPPADAELIAGYVSLTRPTIRIVPVDPFPGSSYGRPLAAPAIFTSLFLLGLLHDLRRVVSQQGYPRLDITVSIKELTASMPATTRNDPAKFKDWVNGTIAEVTKMYEGLQPDDAFVHTDSVTVNRPVGTVDSSSLGAVDGLIQALERMAVRALKTMPFMMASTQSTTETQANREWEVQAAGIKSIQHYCETLLGRLLTLGLQAQGRASSVTFRFAELRAAEMMRDAQTEAIQIQNAFNRYANGWISQDTAAQQGAGQAKADSPAPRILPRGATETTDAAAPQVAPEPEPGANRGTPLRVVGGES